MMSHSLRLAGIATCASALLLGTPSKSHAIFGWFGNCCKKQTAYMPVAPAPVAQTCQYMPVTSYRTVYKQVPVTTYQPVTSRSWCSCQPVTTYRPVTTYVTQAQQVPFTTYKPVYAAVTPAPSVTYNAPAAAAVSYTQPAASCCGGAQAATPAPMSFGTPPAVSTPSYGTPNYGTPGYGTPNYGTPGYGAPTSQPTLPVSPPPGITTQKVSPTPPTTGTGQSTGYNIPPARPQYVPQSQRTTALPSYNQGSPAYNTASYNTSKHNAVEWRAQQAQTFPTHTEARVAISQSVASPTAPATGGQFRWRPAQN
jgi:hypothetical protein